MLLVVFFHHRALLSLPQLSYNTNTGLNRASFSCLSLETPAWYHCSSWLDLQAMSFSSALQMLLHVNNKEENWQHTSTHTLHLRYLKIELISDLSWSSHISCLCTKARQLVGLLYRHFYKHASTSSLFQLYKSFISYIWSIVQLFGILTFLRMLRPWRKSRDLHWEIA